MILVTGAAGFIGFHVAQRLLDRGEHGDRPRQSQRLLRPETESCPPGPARGPQGLRLPSHRYRRQGRRPAISSPAIADLTGIVHLAAQAGVRHSLVDPFSYVDANVTGHLVGAGSLPPAEAVEASGLCQLVLRLWRQHQDAICRGRSRRTADFDLCGDQAGRRADVERHMAISSAFPRRGFASSPSMAPGAGPTCRLSCSPRPSWPASRSRSSTAARCSATSPISTTSSPACSPHSIARRRGTPGNRRIGSIISATIAQVALMDFIATIEKACGRKAKIDFQPMQPGDVKATFSDIEATTRDLGYPP